MTMNSPLEIRNLVKQFGGLTATDNVSLELEDGESLGLIGPNGAGKTTIFSLVMGELRQTAGKILAWGEEISTLATHQRIGRGVCRTYQIPRPFAGMSVAENIRMGLMPNSLLKMLMKGPNRDAELELALSVGFKEEDMKRRPAELTMGELRKLELARTLATRPSVLLLDEVFAGLAKGEIKQIAELIQAKRQQGISMVIVSHDLKSLGPLIDRAVALNQGKIISQGSFAEVLDDQAVRSSYLGSA